MAYPAAVEKWRSLIEKYFKPEDVDKALYVINGESGGNPLASGDGGNSIGLFQMNMGGGLGTGSSPEQLQDPEYNIKLAAQAVYGGSGWGPWGEGRTYQGKPFGALGNNPYKSEPLNARTPVGGAIRPVTPEGDTGGTTGGDTKPPYTIGGGYSPTGDYETDANAYWEAAQKAYGELADYQSSSTDIIVPDENEGAVYKWDPSVIDPKTGEEVGGLVLDEVGTRILQRALLNTQQLDRLYAAKKAGLVGSGENSAAAFVAAEKEKAADAASDYEDYVRRIGDLTAIEDIPASRAAQFASTMATINKNKTPYTISGGMGMSGRPEMTDLSPFINSMRNAIPKQAPAPYDIPPEVFDMTKIDPTKIPARPPEEILGEVGLQPPVPQQRPLIPRIDQPKVANVGRTIGDLIQGLIGNPSRTANPMQDIKNKWPIIGQRYR